MLVYHDLLGLTEGHLPRFVKRYANLSREIRDALEAYAADVRSGAFPDDEHTYAMPEEELAAFEQRKLGERRERALTRSRSQRPCTVRGSASGGNHSAGKSPSGSPSASTR